MRKVACIINSDVIPAGQQFLLLARSSPSTYWEWMAAADSAIEAISLREPQATLKKNP